MLLSEEAILKIHALIAVYNAYETIWKCLESLIDVVDRIVILDGRWTGFEGESLTSNDGTSLEIEDFIVMCKQQAEVDIEYFMATEENHQYEARNILLDQVPEGDWFIIIDSDEDVINFSDNFREFLETSKEIAYRCNQKDETQTNAKPYVHPRLLKKIQGMHYGSNHRYLLDINNEIIPLGNSPTFLKLCFFHNGQNKSMRETMTKYKSWLREWEIQHQ